MKEPKLTIGDKKFLVRAIRTFNVKSLRIAWSDSKKTYPDIWIELSKVPVITVTAEWARQSADERRKRLVHELLHAKGMGHNESIGYNSRPDKDTYSMEIYRSIKGSR